jgi:hypothetical protein
MEIMICCGGDPEIAELIDQMWIDIERVPCVGEYLKLFVGDYHLLMKVASVMTMYVQEGNEWFGTIKHGKAEYVVTVEDEEIVEKYN